jgi:hypothetical protein
VYLSAHIYPIEEKHARQARAGEAMHFASLFILPLPFDFGILGFLLLCGKVIV